jgi:hypothetical protein
LKVVARCLPRSVLTPIAEHPVTNAEVLVSLCRTIRDAAGDAVVPGCNTVGHLAAGLVHVQRIGDGRRRCRWLEPYGAGRHGTPQPVTRALDHRPGLCRNLGRRAERPLVLFRTVA